jgi:hypothetical protein
MHHRLQERLPPVANKVIRRPGKQGGWVFALDEAGGVISAGIRENRLS